MHNDTDQPKVLVVIGPSGAGKSSAVRALADRGLVRVHPTWTTRPPRDDEAAGTPEHRFVTDEGFDRLERSGFFLGTAEMFGLGHRYGLAPIDHPARDGVDLVMLRAPLLGEFARLHPAFRTYQVAASPDVAEARLVARGVSDTERRARVADNAVEVAMGLERCDRCFVNDGPLDTLVAQMAEALADDFPPRRRRVRSPAGGAGAGAVEDRR